MLETRDRIRQVGAQGALLLASFLSLSACAASDDAGPSGGNSNASRPNAPGGTIDDPGGVNVNPGGTNVNLGGAQDIGFFRGQLEAGVVPALDSLDAAGFFAEHHTELPPPACGERICLQPMLAVMGNLMDGGNCTMLHLGLNSPLAADPGTRPPLSLTVVVDVSGSMQGSKIDFVQQGLELLLDGMRDSDQLALVSYSDAARVEAPMTDVATHRVELRTAVRRLRAEGATNLSAGLEAGYRQAAGHYDSGRQNRVILLSDGNPTAGTTASGAILELSHGYNSDGIGLTTIGLGSDFNIGLMRDLALQADGNFYFVEDAGAVDEVFADELDYFVVPVAFDLELRLTAGESYDFGRAVGTPFWEDTGAGGFLDVPSVFLAHRDSDDDVTSEDGRRGGGSSLMVELLPRRGGEPGATVATLDLTFREPGSEVRVEDRVEVSYPYAPDALRSEGFFEADNLATIQKSFVMLNIFVGMENAVRAFHDGIAGPATIAALDRLIAAVTDYNDEVGDTDIRLDLEILELLRGNLIASGVEPRDTPLPADPWPAD